jgi:hypothetical protein
MDPSNTSNPLPTASNVDAIFSPTRPQLQLGEREYSPDFQHKLTETATRAKSFAQASVIAEAWCGQSVSSRNLGRVVEEVGHELILQRDALVDDFKHHRRDAEGLDPQHELAAVFVDGGRVQIRDATPGLGAGVHNGCWKEDKIARLQTMKSPTHAEDPCPEPPPCFMKPIIHKSGANDSAENSQELKALLDSLPALSLAQKFDWQPQPLLRTCVGTMRPLEEFRWMVQAEAKRRHFYTAKKRAFVADGSAGNWSLRDRHFPDFEPIVDFVHVAEYLHDAAKVLNSQTQGCQWVRDVWQGRVTAVIDQLRQALDKRRIGQETLDEKHECHKLQRAWTYLTNNADKMDYPRYRQNGLPTTSSLIESQVKEINARVKGSEKFWYESNAEGMIQLICRTLCDEGPTLEDHFKNRPTSPFRRNYETTLAI